MTAITKSEALEGVEGIPEDADADKSSALKGGEKEAVELEGKRSFFQLRKNWSYAIITWISALIACSTLLTFCVGFGFCNFEKYQWFVTSVTVETFLQIVGIGYIATQYLFSER